MEHSFPDVFSTISSTDIMEAKMFMFDIVFLYCFHDPTNLPLKTEYRIKAIIQWFNFSNLSNNLLLLHHNSIIARSFSCNFSNYWLRFPSLWVFEVFFLDIDHFNTVDNKPKESGHCVQSQAEVVPGVWDYWDWRVIEVLWHLDTRLYLKGLTSNFIDTCISFPVSGST